MQHALATQRDIDVLQSDKRLAIPEIRSRMRHCWRMNMWLLCHGDGSAHLNLQSPIPDPDYAPPAPGFTSRGFSHGIMWRSFMPVFSIG